MTTQDSDSSSEHSSPLTRLEPRHYKAIIAIGVIGTEEDVTRFIALWIADSEHRAHRINTKLFRDRLTLLPLPEDNDGEVQDVPEGTPEGR